jgi:alkanesulfonate monooxygenase SsuD/methylene tetrahydromethanopterin reductase-like flavin-dependent oxidoreductase (luciferase family)
LVGAIPFRNPGLVAKMATTLDHITAGRAILGLGGAWFEYEHTAHGIDFGASPGTRLKWLDEAVGGIRTVLDGGAATSPEGGRYNLKNLRQEPLPIQKRLPIMIGGSGERKTLRTVAKYADMWNAMGKPAKLAHKVEVLRAHCVAVGRDVTEIEFTVGCKPIIRDSEAEARKVWKQWMDRNKTPISDVEDDSTFWPGTPEQIAQKLLEVKPLGFNTAIAEIPAPYDDETLARFIGEVKPLVDRA